MSIIEYKKTKLFKSDELVNLFSSVALKVENIRILRSLKVARVIPCYFFESSPLCFLVFQGEVHT